MHLCECGCGGPTSLAKQTSARFGHVQGQPVRFIRGHQGRKAAVDYRATRVGGHYVKLHRARAEKALGKILPRGAVVHHGDGSRREDAPLVICQDQRYHQLLHVRMRVRAAGADPNTHAICGSCRKAKPFTEFAKATRRRYGLDDWCKDCRRLHRESKQPECYELADALIAQREQAPEDDR